MNDKPKSENVTFKISSKLGDAWKINDEDKLDELQRFLEHSDSLVELINRYETDRWQAYSADEVYISDSHDNTGDIQVDYTRHQYNGCSDLNGEQEAHAAFSFVIDLEKMEITLVGDPVRERTTFEEF
jgi:hypothetical protein